jgi:hypothetical protein
LRCATGAGVFSRCAQGDRRGMMECGAGRFLVGMLFIYHKIDYAYFINNILRVAIIY